MKRLLSFFVTVLAVFAFLAELNAGVRINEVLFKPSDGTQKIEFFNDDPDNSADIGG